MDMQKEVTSKNGNGNFQDFWVFNFGLILKSKTWKTRKYLLEEVGNFWGFWVFDFDPYTEIENSENSEIITTLVNSKECVLLEEVGNFRCFWVFDFGPYTEI